MPRIMFLSQPPDLEPDVEPDGRAILAAVGPTDFPRYRGANGDGLVKWAVLDTDWKKAPPTVQWEVPSSGGYSGLAVAGNIVVTLEQRDQQETVVCYHRNHGTQNWAYGYGAYYKDAMGDGPRSTPAIHDGRIYTIGATGVLLCLDTKGTKIWSTNILEDAKAKNLKWGLAASPLLVDDLVIALAGIDPDAPAASSVIAFEQATGKIRWRTGNRAAAYSSPQLITLGSVPQILIFDAAGLVSYEPQTGKELWHFPWTTNLDMNIMQPVVLGNDRIFISSEPNNGCAMLRITSANKENTAWRVESIWANKNLAARFANPVSDGNSIFGLHGLRGVLTCLDVETGKVRWKGDAQDPGQLLLANNALIVVNGDDGSVALIDNNSVAFQELARFQSIQSRKKTWNTPALAGDQLFIRNQARIVCLKLARR